MTYLQIHCPLATWLLTNAVALQVGQVERDEQSACECLECVKTCLSNYPNKIYLQLERAAKVIEAREMGGMMSMEMVEGSDIDHSFRPKKPAASHIVLHGGFVEGVACQAGTPGVWDKSSMRERRNTVT